MVESLWKYIFKRQNNMPSHYFQEPCKVALFISCPYTIKKYLYQRRGYDIIEEIHDDKIIEENIKAHVNKFSNGDSLFLYIFQNKNIDWKKLLHSITKKINIFIIADGFHLTDLSYLITSDGNSIVHLNKLEDMLYTPSIIIVENMEIKFPLYRMFEFILSGFRSTEKMSLERLLSMMHMCHGTNICIYVSSPDLIYYSF